VKPASEEGSSCSHLLSVKRISALFVPPMSPIAHMSRGEVALALVMWPAMPFVSVHLVPDRCQVPAPGWLPPLEPNSQTSRGPSATMLVNLARGFQPPLGSTDQVTPFQRSTLPPR